MKILNDHEERLTQVEKGMVDLGHKFGDIQKDVTSMQASQSRLETAVLDEGRKTRETLDSVIVRLFDRDNHIRESKTDVKVKWIGVVGSFVGGGGLIAFLTLLFQ